MSGDETRTVSATEAAVTLHGEPDGEIRTDRFEVEIATGRAFVVDIVDDELSVRLK